MYILVSINGMEEERFLLTHGEKSVNIRTKENGIEGFQAFGHTIGEKLDNKRRYEIGR